MNLENRPLTKLSHLFLSILTTQINVVHKQYLSLLFFPEEEQKLRETICNLPRSRNRKWQSQNLTSGLRPRPTSLITACSCAGFCTVTIATPPLPVPAPSKSLLLAILHTLLRAPVPPPLTLFCNLLNKPTFQRHRQHRASLLWQLRQTEQRQPLPPSPPVTASLHSPGLQLSDRFALCF